MTGTIVLLLLKAGGRYACNLRMEQCLDSIKAKDAGVFLFEDEQQFNPNAQTESLYREMWDALEDGSWNGDRDSWDTHIRDMEWRALTVDRRQCTDDVVDLSISALFSKREAILKKVNVLLRTMIW